MTIHEKERKQQQRHETILLNPKMGFLHDSIVVVVVAIFFLLIFCFCVFFKTFMHTHEHRGFFLKVMKTKKSHTKHTDVQKDRQTAGDIFSRRNTKSKRSEEAMYRR